MNTQRFGGPWTEQKLNALENYLGAYLTIFTRNPKAAKFTRHYVDAFAGSGLRSVRDTTTKPSQPAAPRNDKRGATRSPRNDKRGATRFPRNDKRVSSNRVARGGCPPPAPTPPDVPFGIRRFIKRS